MSQFLIYGLIDPETLLIRYVGRSSSGLRRPQTHGTPRNLMKRTHCARWIRGLRARGLDFGIVVLESLTFADGLNDAERWWIAYGRASGWHLANHTEGGEGMRGYRPTPQSRASRSKALANRYFSPEHKAKISAAKVGVPKSPEHRAKLADAQRGRKYSAERRALMSKIAKEHLQRSPRAPISEVTREKQRAAKRGKTQSAETRAKRAESMRDYHARRRTAAEKHQGPDCSEP